MRNKLDFYGAEEVCYIYALHDPRTAEIRYIGRAKNVKSRYTVHIARARHSGRQNRCTTWVRSLLQQGLKPTVTILEAAPAKRWAEREVFWISNSKAAGCKLTNENSGGYGPWEISPETRRRISLAARGNKSRTGQRLSAECRNKLSAIHKARLSLLTIEQRRARVLPMLKKRRRGWNEGWHHTVESKAKIGLSNSKRAKERSVCETT